MAAAHEASRNELFQALVGNPSEPTSDFAEVTRVLWCGLSTRALELRTLLRISVTDEKGLRTAHAGLQLASQFFEVLARLSALSGEPATAVLNDDKVETTGAHGDHKVMTQPTLLVESFAA